jgi:hypothetical protein
MKSELEAFINENIGAFNSRTPGDAVLERLKEQLKETERKKKEKASVISMRLRWVAAACLILLAGGVAFLAINKTEQPQTTAVINVKPAIVTPQEITPEQKTPEPYESKTTVEAATQTETPRSIAIEPEGYERKNILFANLTNKESASERLTAASQVEAITGADNDIVDALTTTMNSDPNTNVRLAALDALSKFYREPYVKKKLLSSLPKQKDPMVQIALIELLTKMKEQSILKQLNKMVSDDNTMQAVKDQAYTGILTLRS